jgi:TetR/AcrR family transcriptional regulator
MAVALEAFAGSGYEGTSLRVIAAGARCDVAMVAHYFGSKFELWRAIIDELAERLREHRDQIAGPLYAPAPSVEQRVRRGIEYLFAHIEARPELGRFVLRELAEGGERAVYVEDQLIRPGLALYLPLWKEAIQAGIFGRVDPTVAHIGLVGAIASLISSRASISRLAGSEFSLDRLRDEFCRGLFSHVIQPQAAGND